MVSIMWFLGSCWHYPMTDRLPNLVTLLSNVWYLHRTNTENVRCTCYKDDNIANNMANLEVLEK